ncbi:MAG TPA: hypothetical protein VHU80_10850, partial [Polyangiaceae bacterium]|nr:hypothetical protein [Polyangiaceae bacterium]
MELEPGELSALHAIAAVEVQSGDAGAATETFSTIADRLIARGWKLAAIHRLRKLSELAEQLPSRARH